MLRQRLCWSSNTKRAERCTYSNRIHIFRKCIILCSRHSSVVLMILYCK